MQLVGGGLKVQAKQSGPVTFAPREKIGDVRAPGKSAEAFAKEGLSAVALAKEDERFRHDENLDATNPVGEDTPATNSG